MSYEWPAVKTIDKEKCTKDAIEVSCNRDEKSSNLKKKINIEDTSESRFAIQRSTTVFYRNKCIFLRFESILVAWNVLKFCSKWSKIFQKQNIVRRFIKKKKRISREFRDVNWNSSCTNLLFFERTKTRTDIDPRHLSILRRRVVSLEKFNYGYVPANFRGRLRAKMSKINSKLC